MTHQSTSQVPAPPLPPSISFNHRSNEDGQRHFISEWDKFAAEEAQRRDAIPAGLDSPRSVVNFFRDLLPDPDDDETQDDLEDENANASNANIVEDDVVEQQIQQPTTQGTFVIEHVPPATVPRRKAPRCCQEQMEHIKQYRRKIDAGVCDEFNKDWTNVCIKKVRAGPNKKKI